MKSWVGYRNQIKHPASSVTKPLSMGDVEVIVLNYGPGKPGAEAKKMPGGKVQYSCLLCNSQQKQIASHLTKKHANMFQNEELEEFQVSLKKFAKAAWYNKWESNEKKRDLEGFKYAKRESVSRSRGKRTAEDLDVDKQKDKRRKKARRSNNPEKFQEEMRYGHIFPCASCHTMKHRDQVVELNQQQEDKIDGKARENHQTLQVINILCMIFISIEMQLILKISHKHLDYEILKDFLEMEKVSKYLTDNNVVRYHNAVCFDENMLIE